ncbi:mechanosensitive ion channel family protein [Sporolactobacillus sp. THM19-2]|uniref:mechanosensitive ion channel family protein n=1 Tax=Sporolactobacillus sp. THM19-2 TaxID=2511171 RepID=UPI00102020F5|nr:mechanosensitive ion channel family protein [Sporolactobacillus sp. THM19-2]RYL93152.1 mechanosensitive ion channel family protein [Sporolactobacillus sp. THM19-2]
MESLEWMGKITLMDGIISCSIILVFFIMVFILQKYIPNLLTKLSRGKIDDKLISALRKPVVLILITTGFFLALSFLPVPRNWRTLFSLFYKSIATFSIGWGFYILSGSIGIFFNHMGTRYDLQFNDIVIPFLSRIAKFLVVVMTLFMILDQWNYHVTGLITGLGIGGLAVAMAAKDTLSNLFGGFVIITDAPFTIGDLIHSGNIEGFVEDINFRSTRIRTLDQALVTVPNSTLANQPITNLSKIGKRRVYLTIPLDLETQEKKVDLCIRRIRKMLIQDTLVDPEDVMVYLDQITSSGIKLMVHFYVKTPDFKVWMESKERYNISILNILNEEGIDLATDRSRIVFDAVSEKQFTDREKQESNDSGDRRRSRDHHI